MATRVGWSVALAAVSACSASTRPNTPDQGRILSSIAAGADSGSEAGQGTMCQPPTGADTVDAGVGCAPMQTGTSCVGSGSSVTGDGSIIGGNEECHPMCQSSQYQLECINTVSVPPPPGPLPVPPASLNCTPIPGTTPSNAEYYCCPCQP
jgi:hypothetical protein